MRLLRRRREPQPTITIDPALGDPVAARLRDRLAERDWTAVRDLLGPVTDPDDRAFYLGICGEVSGVQEWIGDVVAAEPDSTLPLLVRGVHGIFWAWEARGAQRARHTTQEQFREFARRLKTAEDYLDEVVDRDPGDTTAWAFLVKSARGRGVDRDEARRRFSEVVTRHPHHLVAHEHMLQYLCAKWHGSDDEMFRFAREASAAAPDGSSLHDLIAFAFIERWLGDRDDDELRSPAMVAELHAAANRSVRHPQFQRRLGWQKSHNLFALAFGVAWEWIASADQYDVIGDNLVTETPWDYLDARVTPIFLKLRTGARKAAAQIRREASGTPS